MKVFTKVHYLHDKIRFNYKVVHVIQYGGSVQNKSITDNQLTPEEQDRLKKLLVENEEIKRQITEVRKNGKA